MILRQTRFIGCFFAALVIALGAVAAVNALIDVDKIFDTKHWREREFARMVVDGYDIVAPSNLKDSLVQKYLMEMWPTPPQAIALGSSRVLEVSQRLFPHQKFYNFGGPASRLASALAIVGVSDLRREYPSTVVYGAEYWLFSRVAVDADSLEGLEDGLGHINLQLGIDPQAIGIRYVEKKKWKGLFSLAMLRRGLSLYTSTGGCVAMEPRRDDMTPCPVKRVDGSLKYSKSEEDALPEDIARRMVIDLSKRGGMYLAEGIADIDPAKVDAFTKLLHHLQTNGSHVVILFSPLHPLVEAAQKTASDWANVRKIEDLIRNIAANQGIPVVGSYSPTQAQCSAAEFYDEVHPHRTCIERLLRPVLDPLGG